MSFLLKLTSAPRRRYLTCLLAVVVGAMVKHARERYRQSHPIVTAGATPRPKPPYVELDKTPRPPKRIGLEKKREKAVDDP